MVDDFFTFSDEGGLEERIRELDGSLEFIDVIGRGSYGLVAKVAKEGEHYALKLEMLYDDATIDHEYDIQRMLSGIKGIPEAIELYDGAFLMRYIKGENLALAGAQPPEFFDKLKAIVDQMTSRGVSLQSEDARINVMVDEDGNPWIVDFMQSYMEDDAEKLARHNARIFDEIKNEYSWC